MGLGLGMMREREGNRFFGCSCLDLCSVVMVRYGGGAGVEQEESLSFHKPALETRSCQ